jgi:methylated-DNA-[protein]-cysteine S-methyltransferase
MNRRMAMNEKATAGTVLYTIMPSPIGDLLLTSDGEAVTGITMELEHGKPAPAPQREWRKDESAAPLRLVREQLRAYFEGDRFDFDLPLRMAGTSFQRAVWQGLLEIPYAATWSYAALAQHVGRQGASRAVGAANGRNPIAIVVPCHRVIGADGTLTGYGGGLDRKQWLLEHEQSALRKSNELPGMRGRRENVLVGRAR